MDSFFGIGAPEFILILVIAGMVMGPERIGRTARWLGRTTAQLQGISRSFIRQLNAELDVDGEKDALTSTWRDMQDLRRQLDDLKGELTAVTGGAFKEGESALADIKKEVERTIAPPSFVPPKNEAAETADDPPPPMKLPTRIEVVDDPEE
jgi:Sec-independent protein translocase protein TatA